MAIESLGQNTSFQTQVAKILIIDDEKLVRESIVVYLEDSGYLVYEAADGKQGVELFCEFNPDIVLCDLRMPKLDGMEVLKTITDMSPETPIIIISGAGQIQDVVEALRLGARDYLVKPVTDMAVLENAITNALKHQQLQVENQIYKTELENANRELERNLDALQEDQDAGRRAQLQLLPQPNSVVKGFEFEHAIIPSLNLSGDFIDYFEISERYLGFYIADVSGHGAAAAFVTMTLKSLVNHPLRNYKQGESETIIDPAAFVSYLNKELISANLGKYITLFYGVIDCYEMTLSFTAAGQYPAPVIRNQGKLTLLKEDGFPVGLFEWASFQNKKVSLARDFQILMVSDGWLEIVVGKNGPADESFLLDFAENEGMQLSNLLRPVKRYPEEKMPDDITVFTVSKERS